MGKIAQGFVFKTQHRGLSSSLPHYLIALTTDNNSENIVVFGVNEKNKTWNYRLGGYRFIQFSTLNKKAVFFVSSLIILIFNRVFYFFGIFSWSPPHP